MEKIWNAAQKNLEIPRKAEKTAEDTHELGVRLKKLTVQYHGLSPMQATGPGNEFQKKLLATLLEEAEES